MILSIFFYKKIKNSSNFFALMNLVLHATFPTLRRCDNHLGYLSNKEKRGFPNRKEYKCPKHSEGKAFMRRSAGAAEPALFVREPE